MREARDTDLEVQLDIPLLQALPVARATAIFCVGTCFHRRRPVERMEIVVDGVRHPPTASRMPRLDLFRSLHPTLSPEEEASIERDPRSTEDPELRCYRSGFWATIPIEPRDRPGEIELRVDAQLAGGGTASASLGRIEVMDLTAPRTYESLTSAGRKGLIAICMATFDPDVALLRRQIDSLRAQTEKHWICLISDDCSQPDRFETIEETVGNDSRFVVSRSEERIGFYRNFERALEMVPAEADLVALCDQDDRWYPDKLETLRGSIGGAQLVYSDQRLVDARGHVLRETLWEGRRNNHTNFASLLIANTIVGAASLFRRRVIDYALPFPEGSGWQFHDHWLALVAMALGKVAYVDRPLYDYVQHRGAILGQVAADSAEPSRRSDRGARVRSAVWGWRGLFDRWRAAYFSAYLPRELQAQVLLARCSAELTARKRRALRLLVAAWRSPLAFAWLATRSMRALLGRNETLRSEELLVRGIVWRHMIVLRARGRERPRGAKYDAGPPPFDPGSFEVRRVRRWMARR